MTKNKLKTLAILNYVADGYDLKTIAHLFGLNTQENRVSEENTTQEKSK